MMLEQACFGVTALILLLSAARVVTSSDLVHTVLWLGLMLGATAVVFVMLHAPFLAAIQLILYTGGLLTLMLFGIMLTQRDQGTVTIPNPAHRRLAGLLVGGGAFAMFAAAILHTPTLPNTPGADVSTQQLGQQLFTQHALAFEVLALLLLAATLGAIVLSRKADAGIEPDRPEIAERKPLPHPSREKEA